MSLNLDDTGNAREAKLAQRLHRSAVSALVISIALYLATALTHGPEPLEVTLAVLAFGSGLAYMGTTIWVFALRTERKRHSKHASENQVDN